MASSVIISGDQGGSKIIFGKMFQFATPMRFGVTPQAPDFCAIAKAFGIGSSKPKTLDTFAKALRAAKATNAPYLIEFDESLAG